MNAWFPIKSVAGCSEDIYLGKLHQGFAYVSIRSISIQN